METLNLLLLIIGCAVIVLTTIDIVLMKRLKNYLKWYKKNQEFQIKIEGKDLIASYKRCQGSDFSVNI